MTNAQDTNLPLNTDDKEKDKVEVSEVAKEEQTTSVVENKEETEAKEKESVKKHGFFGIFLGGFESSAAGISAALVFGYLASLIFQPKMKR